MTEPLTHARIGYDSIAARGTVMASGADTGFPASAAANAMTYSFWKTGVPSTWQVNLTGDAETCDYFGIAAHTLHSNNVLAVMQAYIDTEWVTMPVLQPIGDLWPFNSGLLGTRSAANRTTTAALRRGVARDGFDIVDENGAAESKFGQYSLAVEPAVTNMFPENVRNAGDTNENEDGFAGTSNVAWTPVHFVSGGGCLKLNAGGGIATCDTDPVAISGSTDYSFSFKIFPETDIGTLSVSVINDSAAAIESVTFNNVPAGKWSRLTIIDATTGGGDTTVFLRVRSSTGEVAYLDEFQMEQASYAHTWVDGTQAAADLAYQPEIIQQFQNDITVNCWLRVTTESVSLQDFFSVATVTGGFTLWIQNASTSDLVISTQDQDSNIDLDILAGKANWDGNWHMVTCTLKPEVTGAHNRFVYFDGRLVYSDESPYFPDWQKCSNIILGWGAGYLGLKGESLMDDLSIVNRAATSSEILGWYQSGVAMDEVTLGIESHDDDRPIMRLVEAATSSFFRVRLTGQTTPLVGVIYMGEALQMERGIYIGHTPIGFARKTVVRPNLSTGGQFLGRSIIRVGSSGSWLWKNLTASWVRKYLDPFLEAARTDPFFILWRPSKFPGEAGYCQTKGDQVPTNSGPRDKMSFDLNAEGLGVE